jgi:hypothetical protein
MRNLSSFIASTAAHGERRSMGAWAAGIFVAVLLAGSATAAYLIGNSMAAPSMSDPAPIAFADESF